MQKQDRSQLIFWLIVTASIFPAWLITAHSFPYTGLSLSFMIISTLFYFLRKPKTNFNTFVYISSLTFSFFLTIRANHLLNFFDIAATIFLTTLLISHVSEYTFLRLFAAPFEGIKAFLTTNNQFAQLGTVLEKIKEKREKSFDVTQVVVSLIISLILLGFILPLLGSANPLFDKILQRFFNGLDLRKIFQNITFFRLLLSGIFFVIISRLSTYIYIQKPSFVKDQKSHITDAALLLPKILIALVIAIFAVTQFQLYFADPGLLKTLGYTNSKLVNEVFGQLSIVSLIVFGLIYNGRGKSKISKILDCILISEGILLTFVGLKSDYDYSALHGFTQKRLYGFAIVFWIFGTYLFYITNIVKQLKSTVFVSRFIIFSCFTLLAINVLNFDYLIYHVNKATVNNKVDYYYLSSLSPDAGHYKDAALFLQRMTNEHGEEMDSWPQGGDFYSYSIIFPIQDLQRKYKTIDFRTFNVSEYKAYLSIKDIHLPQITSTYSPYTQPEVPRD